MNANQNLQQQATAAPSITIAPRNPARGVVVYIVTLTTFKGSTSYPCQTYDAVQRLQCRFLSGIVNSVPRTPPPIAN